MPRYVSRVYRRRTAGRRAGRRSATFPMRSMRSRMSRPRMYRRMRR